MSQLPPRATLADTPFPYTTLFRSRRPRSPYLGIRPGQRGERVAVDSHHCPLVHHLRAETFVEADRGLVPVEHRPFEPCAVACHAELRQMREQRLAEPGAARVGTHEQILEVNAGLALEGRKIGEEERETLRRDGKSAG